MSRKRGAVVIGVNKTGGGLEPLQSAAPGAKAVADWLASEGFEVELITDADRKDDPNSGKGKVDPKSIATALKGFVESSKFEQLVIYFSGHGSWKNDNELWLLSDAPVDAAAAVSWAETAEFAKVCGVPNVVLISDACRTLPPTPQWSRVRGDPLVPNEERSPATVDKFIATKIGRAAYEVPMGADGKKESVFTHCFLNAFRKPDPGMIREVTEDGASIWVVPNKRLGDYLQREVSALLASVNVTYDQYPVAEVLSEDDAYIGRAQITDEAAFRTIPELGRAGLNILACASTT